ncbi:hypothetical protein SGPA1_11442 [Streptomyces misionensis JCM 4497]
MQELGPAAGQRQGAERAVRLPRQHAVQRGRPGRPVQGEGTQGLHLGDGRPPPELPRLALQPERQEPRLRARGQGRRPRHRQGMAHQPLGHPARPGHLRPARPEQPAVLLGRLPDGRPRGHRRRGRRTGRDLAAPARRPAAVRRPVQGDERTALTPVAALDPAPV